jgi:ornithine cyclodeaminase
MHIIELEEIKSRLAGVDLIAKIESGFVAYSLGRSVVPPVGELVLERGEVHIKYGYIHSQPYYVIKIASGFSGNEQLGLPTGDGCMLLFCQQTGQLKSVLLDQGHLTDVRTAVAGAIAAKYFAPKSTTRIGIVGTGVQARVQLEYLESVTECRSVLVWGRSQVKLDRYVRDMRNGRPNSGFRIETTRDIAMIQQQCNLIVTTTPSTKPLLDAENLRPRTHITAVGSDTPDKQEIDSEILLRADLLIADSIPQCQLRGEISQGLRNKTLDLESVIELGHVIHGTAAARTDDSQITVVDLTGVAVQDIQISTAVFDGDVT